VSFLVIALAATAARAADGDIPLRPSIYDNVYALDTTAEEAAPVVRRAPATDDPYAPLGIRAGGFILYPSIALGLGTTNNASYSAGGRPGSFWSVAPALDIRSDWDTNSAAVLLSGSYQDFFDGAAPAQPAGSAKGNLHLDLADRFSMDFTGGASYSEQSLSDPNYPAGADKPPGVIDLNGGVALNGAFGRLQVTVAGAADRTVYENAMSGNTVIDQGDRTNTLYSGRVRLGYELNPTLTPFVEAEIGRRLYDRPIDDENIARASTSYALRAGIEVDRDPLLKGEVALGAIHETFDDAALADIDALSFEGTLTWSPRRLLTVTLAGNTTLNPSTNVLSSGSVLYTGSLDIAYAWRRNVTFDWVSSVSNEDYQGIGEVDTTFDTGFSATWKLNRELQLVAGYTHQWLVSNDPSLPYQADTVKAELKLLR
jgi:hypothetical protein